MRRIIIMSVLFIVVLFIAGCAYTTKSTLPENIKTIEVVTFGNTTYYNELEGDLTREIIKAINLTPGLKVVNKDADAILSGTITNVTNAVTIYDVKFQPVAMVTVITARYSLFDNKDGSFIYNNHTISSNTDSSKAGVYDSSKDPVYANPQKKALAELGQTIVRSVTSIW